MERKNTIMISITDYFKKMNDPDFLYGKFLSFMCSRKEIKGLLDNNSNKETQYYTFLIKQVRPRYTMLKTEKSLNLFNSVKIINNKNEGDIVECGVVYEGALAVMGAVNEH